MRKRCPWSQVDLSDLELFSLVKRIQFLGTMPGIYSLPNNLLERLQLVAELLEEHKSIKHIESKITEEIIGDA